MIKTLYEQFQHWSDKGNVKIIGDTHFGDEDMKQYFDYPEPQFIANRINAALNKNDTLVILGDVGDETWVKKLKARRKVLIMGNHDKGISVYRHYFDEIYQGALVIAEKIMLSHERVRTDWCLNIHGHHHGRRSHDKYHMNVCSDLVGFMPISLKDIIQGGALKQITSLHNQAINYAKNSEKKERCKDCELYMKLQMLDYSQGGCIHEDMDGYACTVFADEGYINWMYGITDETFCEAFTPRRINRE